MSDAEQSADGDARETVEIDRRKVNMMVHRFDRVLKRGSLSTPVAHDHVSTATAWLRESLAEGDADPRECIECGDELTDEPEGSTLCESCFIEPLGKGEA